MVPESKPFLKLVADDLKSHAGNYQKIIDAGYDVNTTAKWLADFYSTIIE